MITRKLLSTGAACLFGFTGVAAAQDDDTEASGEGMWMSAIEETREGDSRVPTRGGVSVAAQSGAETYRVRQGDTLWDISSRQLGNAYDWPRLWSFNPDITNPHWIYPDTLLKLAGDGGGAVAAGGADDGGGGAGSAAALGGAPMRRTTLGAGDVLLGDEAFMDAEALKDSGFIVGAFEEGLFLSPSDWCYVRFPGKPPVQPGSLLTVFRALKEEEHAKGQGEGQIIRIQGIMKLMDYDENRRLGRAVVVEALDPIERGFRVSETPRRFQVTATRPASKAIEGEIIAAIRPRMIVGAQYLVFTNRGSEEGLERGNRMFVVRKGDMWREMVDGHEEWSGALEPDSEAPDEDEYPEEIVAEARVVDVRAKTATLLVTRSLVELEMGDRLKTIQGR